MRHNRKIAENGRRRMEKVIAVFLTVIMVTGFLPMTNIAEIDFSALFAHASAAEIVDSGTCGDNVTWTLDDEGTLTIRGTGRMTDYSEWMKAPWYNQIKNVIIEDGVTYIGNYSFSYAKKIIIPASVEIIGKNAFDGDWGRLYSDWDLYIYNPNCTILCLDFGNAIVHGYENSTAQEMAESKNVVFLPFGYNGIIDEGTCGNYVWSVTSDGNLSINGSGSMGLESLGGPTAEWRKYHYFVKEIMISEGISDIGTYAFFEFWNVESIILPNSINIIRNSAFANCSSLSDVHIGENVKTIEAYAFDHTSLHSVIIPDSVTKIENSSFGHIYETGVIYIGSKLKNIAENSFFACDLSFDVVQENPYFCSRNGVLFSKDEKVLVRYPGQHSEEAYIIPESVQTIGPYAFELNHNLNTITVPGNVVSIEKGAFMNTEVETFEIQEGVKNIGNNAFFGSYNANIMLPQSIEIIGSSAFMGAQGSHITVCNNVKYIGKDAFAGGALYYSPYNGEDAIYWGNNLITVSTEKTGEFQIKEGTKTVADGAFASCSNVTDIIVPSSIRYFNDSLEETAFYNNDNNWDESALYLDDILVSVKQQKATFSIKDGTKIIAAHAVPGTVEEIELCDSLECICYSAFNGDYLSKLTTITIPDCNIEFVGKPFFDLPFLRNITILNSELDLNESGLGLSTIVVTCSYEELYQAVETGNQDLFYSYTREFSDADHSYICVYGWSDSTAEVYAENNGFTFISLCNNHASKHREDVIATCTGEGVSGRIVCEDCGAIIEEGENVPALGHIDENEDTVCDRCGAALSYGEFLTVEPSSDNYWLYYDIFDSELKISYNAQTNLFYLFENVEGEEENTWLALCEFDLEHEGTRITEDFKQYWIEQGGDISELDTFEADLEETVATCPGYINPPIPKNVTPKPVYVGEENCPNTCVDWYILLAQRTDAADWQDSSFTVYETNNGNYCLIQLPVYVSAQGEDGEWYDTDEIEGYECFGDYIGSSRWNTIYGEPLDLHEPTGHIDEAPKDNICDRCGITLAAECAHETTELRNAVSPTCTDPGYTGDLYCVECGEIVSEGAVIEALGHDWSGWTADADGEHHSRVCNNDAAHKETETHRWNDGTVTTAPTCVTEGEQTYACSACGAEKQEALEPDAENHINTKEVPAQPETCTEKGYTAGIYCEDCEQYISGHDEIAAIGHDYKVEITMPTCTEKGYTTYTCNNCGDSYTDDENAATGHSFTNYVSDGNATCTVDGMKTAACENGCGEKKTVADVGSAIGHNWGDWTADTDGEHHSRVCKNDATHKDTIAHTWEISDTGEATCTDAGYMNYVCADCGAEKSEYTEALGHGYDLGFEEMDEASTCTVRGYYMKVCLDCGEVVEDITKPLDASNHKGETELRNERASTCTEDGYTGDLYCKGCGELITKGEMIEAPGHKWNNGAVTTEPGCETKGVKTFACTVCGDTRTEELDATGHDYKAEVTAPTCTKQGYTTYTCAKCGDSYTDDETPVLGHGYKLGFEEMDEASTCTVRGYYMKVCLDCGEVVEDITKSLDASNHKGETELRNEKVATCTEDGYTGDLYCKACGGLITKGEMIEAPGHKWNNGVVTTEPGCETKGVKTFTCTVCGETKTEELDARGHDYKDEVIAPTCTEQGYTTHTCANCGNSYTDEKVPAAGHKWNNGAVTTEPGCETKGVKTFTCTVCGETRTEELNATGHDYKDEVTAPTCTEQGYTTHTCANCGDSFTTDVTVALGHDWGDWSVTKEATYLHEGEKTRVCLRCDEEEIGVVEKLTPDDYKVDSDSGSQLGFQENTLPVDTQIFVDEEFDGAYIRIMNAEKGNVKNQKYNITLESNGVKVQPNGYVLVKLPIPAGYNKNKLRIYYISTDGNGSTQLIDSYVEGNYICFETTHFSVYAIVDESQTQDNEASQQNNDDICQYCRKVHTGPFARITKFFHKIFYFFAHMFGRM